MKQVWSRFLLLVLMNSIYLLGVAQDSTGSSSSVTTRTTTTTTTWYTQPWVWVVGGAVFLIILVALLRVGNSSTRDREVSRTTVIKDNDL